ncbi:MAG: sensor domain-containing diguanylate cyclase [Candidatus Zixiibacteriota bacterium]
MKLIYRESRSILPRVESLHLFSRLIVILGVAAYLSFGELAEQNFTPLVILLVVEIGLCCLWWFLNTKKTLANANLFLMAIAIDVILITGIIHFTGGVRSEFYIFYFLTVSLGAYMMPSKPTLLLCLLITISFIAGNYQSLSKLDPLEFSLHFVAIWFYALTVNYVAEYIRRSEGRLLKVFNTLNRRTSELEKTHAQLEMVYENSRILAGILDFDQIIEEIIKIGERVLDYPALGILLTGPGKSLTYRGRLIGGQKETRLKKAGHDEMQLAYRVVNAGEPVRVIDLSKRSDYRPLLKSARSVMLVPMVTHGRATGLLCAESPRRGIFNERDEAFLSVLARSAAMALENAILHRKTEELTIIDDLTGVKNYRYFSDKIREEKRRAVRYNQPLSLIMLDIDWFKKFNDNYGHEVGNHVLVNLVQVIKRGIRDVDILCRYGGEEFIIILPQTIEREAVKIAERIRKEVEVSEFGGDGIPDLKVTVSVGVSSYPENGLTEEELVHAVDQAMYRAKGSGKNTVCTV